MLAAWTILVNRRQEKIICTKPGHSERGENRSAPPLDFRLIAIREL